MPHSPDTTPTENPDSPDCPITVQKKTWWLRTTSKVLLYATLTVGAAGLAAYKYLVPEKADRETPTEAIVAPNEESYFDDIDDGNIFGRNLVYIDHEKQEVTKAKFFREKNRIKLLINDTFLLATEEKLPNKGDILELLGISNDPQDLIKAVAKKGSEIEIDLNLHDSQCRIPSRYICELGKELRDRKDPQFMLELVPYELHGRVRSIPGIQTKGKQNVWFVIRNVKTEGMLAAK